MAGRALTPATRRSLGGPLPHQQADRPRGHPAAADHLLCGPCGPLRSSGISHSFPWLFRSAGQVPHVLLTRSPVSPGRSPVLPRLACVRRAASVRPEPGSNSPLEIFEFRRSVDEEPPCAGPSKVGDLPGHGDSIQFMTADLAVRNQSHTPPCFTADAVPKGGVHVHWLLAHCAVFKERARFHPSSPLRHRAEAWLSSVRMPEP